MVELSNLKLKESARIYSISDDLEVKRRLLDIGFTKGSEIVPVLISPFDGPVAYRIKNTTVALRKEDSSCILVEKVV